MDFKQDEHWLYLVHFEIMCRLAIYIGPQLSLENLLLKPEYGLMEQSWGPKEMNEGKLNADGYGFAWFNNGNQPASYRNPMPIWTDINLESLARTLTASQWFANVRSATVGLDVSHANTQPFTDEKFIYLHNGYIKDFKINYRAKKLMMITTAKLAAPQTQNIFLRCFARPSIKILVLPSRIFFVLYLIRLIKF